jgi:hypothetical protein
MALEHGTVTPIQPGQDNDLLAGFQTVHGRQVLGVYFDCRYRIILSGLLGAFLAMGERRTDPANGSEVHGGLGHGHSG